MQHIEMHCKGTTPLLMDKTHDPEGKTIEEIAELCIYRMLSGRLCIPRKNFFACLQESWDLIELDPEIPPGSIKAESLTQDIFGMDHAYMILTGSKQYEIDIVKGRNPEGSGPVGIVRPRFDDWGFLVYFWFDDEILPEAPFRRLMNAAGGFVGLGAYRGTRGGLYGRFEINHWQHR